MPNWRRTHVPGGSFFFTLVTDRRTHLFRSPGARTRLGDAVRRCRRRWPFALDAIVLLPDHLHAIWSLPAGDDDFSRRWAWIKKEFAKAWLSCGGAEQHRTVGRVGDGRRGIWQPKFWEHTLETEADFDRHFDYLHYNPVRHGWVKCPHDWPWSSFHRWAAAGVYPRDWACGRSGPLAFDDLDKTVGE